MDIPNLLSNKVVIVGKGPGYERAREYISTDYNIWAIPQSYTDLEQMMGHRIDLVFEVHEPQYWRRKKATLHRLNTLYNKPKLIVPQRVPGWTDNSYLLPTAELQAMGLPLLNSFAWMIAYAIYRGITTIVIRGVNLDVAQEAEHERDGLMYIFGYLKSSGITLDIDSSSGLVQGNGLCRALNS